ncbi:helix-turn-helix domain-containing protein [Pseudomonas sp. SZMC_28357]|jgi:predicted transcriptional regulator|uniref:helix-turn-helix domain-containing protein n=1 Tax=Pseudomonas TaxID=286 RepID=UPI00065499E0|nr:MULTISPECIES: helix-turn-helix domain-containing protein [Pseudomonas]MDR9754882.1 helix-turn-helix domain-containing protein [Pseudomonas sp. SZMC_28357]
MAGKKATPDQNAQAVILREAGYTIPAIAHQLEISVSTAQRILKANKTVAGATQQKLIAKAREDMLNAAFALEKVQLIAASLVMDDLSISHQIRSKLSIAIEQLDVTDITSFRALAASATALKLTQDVGRRALPLERMEMALDVEEMPELRIHIMTEYDVAKLRAEQRKEDAEQNGDAEAIEGELETLSWLESKEDEAWNERLAVEDDDIVCEGFDSEVT